VAGGSGQEQVVGTPVVGVPNNINPDALSPFRSGLPEKGHVEGFDVLLESRTTSQAGRLPSLAAELVQRHKTN
jgi:hypothetical protein